MIYSPIFSDFIINGHAKIFHKYLTINFRYLSGEETRLFFSGVTRLPLRKKPGFFAAHRKKSIVLRFRYVPA
ncbi:Uncharacterized protein dnm_009470 [Desulfonema magnum]|uniref:Uncharacterized protein n=1 Tax=Desulfonema magnum TaxID=45655 RepID=A0A975GLL3_9BACT|nr:Uncharacterized protein dnm_009470 [Desulfonema magnum]